MTAVGWSERWDDLDGWLTETGTRRDELQTYVAEGCHEIVTAGGYRNLRVTARQDEAGQWRSALLRSRPGRFVDMTTPGTLTVRVRVPLLPGAWPAVWLIGERSWAEGDSRVAWPACGEVDLLEVPGVRAREGAPLLHGNMHGATEVGTRWQCEAPIGYPGLPGWVTVGLQIAPGSLTWTVDGRARKTWRPAAGRLWPFGTGPGQSPRAGLLLNVAVGGWGGVPVPGLPAVMEVGEIRYTPAAAAA